MSKLLGPLVEIIASRHSVFDVFETFFSAIRPPSTMKMSTWVEKNRELSSDTSAEPGPYSFANAEYQRAVHDYVVDERVKKIVCEWGSQLGKSELLLSTIAYFPAEDPCPMGMVQPCGADAKNFSKERITPMINNTRPLKGIFSDQKSRNKDNTIDVKRFPGGYLAIVGAHSPTGVCARPLRIVLADEVDRWVESAGVEGDPLALIEKRMTTFPNRKMLMTSTPTIEGASRIHQAFLEGTQEYFYVPCPFCGHFQRLHWTAPEGKKRGCVLWDKDKEGNVNLSTVRYACGNCHEDWQEYEKNDAVSEGEWRAEFPEHVDNRTTNLSSLYSSMVTLAELCDEWHKAQGHTERLKVFVNTRLAQTFKIKGETISDEPLYDRREMYNAREILPQGVAVITAAIDTQDDRLEIEIKGWGRKYESWSLEYLTLQGDPSILKGPEGKPSIWEQAWELLSGRKYDHPCGAVLHVSKIGLDSGGHHTDTCYKWTLQHSELVWALKGSSIAGAPVWPGRSSQGKGSSGIKCPVYVIGVHTIKDVIFAALKQTIHGPSYCHHPDHPRDYFSQLCAEAKIEKLTFGRAYWVWVKVSSRNEAWDLHCYNYAILEGQHLDIDVIADNMDIAQVNADALEGTQTHSDQTVQRAIMPRTKRRGRRSYNPFKGRY